MAKLTKKQMNALTIVLNHLERAHSFILKDDTAVAKLCKHATTDLHYSRASDNTTLYVINKEYGSNLTGLLTGIGTLRQFCEANT